MGDGVIAIPLKKVAIQAYQTDPDVKFVVPQLIKTLPKQQIKLEKLAGNISYSDKNL